MTLSIEFIILITVLVGLISYFVGFLHKGLSSVVTIFGSLFVFGAIGYLGYTEQLTNEVLYLNGMEFEITHLGFFFSFIVSFVFLMVSFFNPFFIKQYKFPRLYNMLYLFSLAGVIGVFYSSNLLYLFFFFEFVVWTSLFLIPMGRSRKAASWYYGFSAAGSFMLLFAIFVILQVTGSFNINGLTELTGNHKLLVFILMSGAAFTKLGAFPLHIWLPKVLTNSPDPITAVFSGGLEKLGAFVGLLAIVKLGAVGYVIPSIDLPLGQGFVAVLGALTIVFGTLMAIRQDDAKKLLAYSSMSNGGYILVAFSMLTPQSVAGGLYHVIAHAVASTAAFLAIAAVSRVTGTTKIKELGGLIHKMPVTYMVYLIAIISMAGIPPMGGFISKWMIFQSVMNKGMVLVAVATIFGSIGSFLYVFRPLAALFLGQELPQFKKVKEVPFFMMLPLIILSLVSVYTGVFPQHIIPFINDVTAEIASGYHVESTMWTIQGWNENSILNASLISLVFGFGVFVAFLIFIVLKKSKKVDLMDTYTSGNFVYTEELLHYSVDFYAPLERLYEKYINIMKNFYKALAQKVKEFGAFMKYFFFTSKPEVTILWIVLALIFLLWGEI